MKNLLAIVSLDGAVTPAWNIGPVQEGVRGGIRYFVFVAGSSRRRSDGATVVPSLRRWDENTA